MQARKRDLPWWLMLPALLFMMWLGARGLNMDPLFYDGELLSVGHAGGLTGPYTPLQTIESVRTLSSPHGPFYFVLLGAWAGAVGWQPLALRSLALFFGLLAAAMTYRVGKDLFSSWAGLYAGILLCISFFFIDFTHNIRMYTLLPLVLMCVLWCYQRLLNPQHSPRGWEWAALFISTASVLYIHYLGGFILGALGVYHLLFAPKNRRWLVISAVMTAAVLMFLPWVEVMLRGERDRWDLSDVALGPGAILSVIGYLFGNGVTILSIGAAGLAGYALYRRQRGALLVWVLLVLGVLAMIVFNMISPVLPPSRFRYLLMFWPLLVLLGGLAIWQLRCWPLLQAGILLVWLIAGFLTNQSPDFEVFKSTGNKFLDRYPPYPIIMQEMRPLTQPGDFTIIFTDSESPLRRPRPVFPSMNEFYFRSLQMDSHIYMRQGEMLPETIAQENENVLGVYGSIWLVYEPFRLPVSLDRFRQVLLQKYQPCGLAVARAEIHIEQYVLSAGDCAVS